MERVPHRVAFRPPCNFNFFFYCFWTEFFLTTLSKLLDIRRFLFIGKNWECKFFKSKWCFCLLLNLCRLLLENADKLKISWIKIICEENIAPELWSSCGWEQAYLVVASFIDSKVRYSRGPDVSQRIGTIGHLAPHQVQIFLHSWPPHPMGWFLPACFLQYQGIAHEQGLALWVWDFRAWKFLFILKSTVQLRKARLCKGGFSMVVVPMVIHFYTPVWNTSLVWW